MIRKPTQLGPSRQIQSFNNLFNEAAAAVARLARSQSAKGEQFDVVRDLIDRLPYAAAEFALANLRLDNALGYYEREVPGAARYELAMLQRTLTNEADNDR